MFPKTERREARKQFNTVKFITRKYCSYFEHTSTVCNASQSMTDRIQSQEADLAIAARLQTLLPFVLAEGPSATIYNNV